MQDQQKNPRKPSIHKVAVFNPCLDPAVAERLKVEQAADPSVIELACIGKFGMVQTSEGIVFLDDEGNIWMGNDESQCNVDFYRLHEKGWKGIGSAEGTLPDYRILTGDIEGDKFVGCELFPFDKLVLTIEECQSFVTGEATLDEFILRSPSGERNYQSIEEALDRRNS